MAHRHRARDPRRRSRHLHRFGVRDLVGEPHADAPVLPDEAEDVRPREEAVTPDTEFQRRARLSLLLLLNLELGNQEL